MKKILNITLAGSVLVAAAALTACSDAFLEEKKDFNNVNPSIYDTYQGAQLRVDDLYAWCQPGGPKTGNNGDRNAMNMGTEDQYSRSTEEYNGFGQWVNETIELNPVTGYDDGSWDYFYIQRNNIQNGVYGRIRNVNDVIRGIEGGALPQAEKDELLGQAYFWRAWCYYRLAQWYGGVPIVKEVLDPVEGPGTPRSSAREVFEFIFDDLDKAAAMLEEATGNGGWSNPAADWGRVTTGTALALKGRVMNLWASPIFNRQNEQSRWTEAYEFQSKALDRIKACGYHLVEGSKPYAGDWADLFVRSDANPEALLLTLYNDIVDNDQNTDRNNGWEKSIRPKDAGAGSGGKEPTALMVDLFPMKDGKLPTVYNGYTRLSKSEIAYDAQCPWMNRDPRFYRTFAFPGVRWTYNGTYSSSDAYYQPGANYTVWSYVWYLDSNAAAVEDRHQGSSQGPDNNSSATGFYIRKRTCDNDVSTPNYVYSNGFDRSATPWIELRYAEVLLNLAEAAAMAGHTEVAVEQLRAIRSRVGYEGDCGIANGMDQQTAVAAVLYERQIELAYEGKRFEDMRRWMLFDGGATLPEGAPSTWAVSGWGGNTCTWLGFRAFNGQTRERYEFRAADNGGIGGTQWDEDPIDHEERPTGVDLNSSDRDEQFETLKQFYADHLVMKKKLSADDSEYNAATGVDYKITFRPRYYLLGFRSSAQINNPSLPQTIGWEDYNRSGANGTFDPLAETAE